jgi:hypothetical protein
MRRCAILAGLPVWASEFVQNSFECLASDREEEDEEDVAAQVTP